MKKKLNIVVLFIVMLLVSACGNNNSSTEENASPDDAPSFNDVYMAVENAFKKELHKENDFSAEEVFQGYILADLTDTETEEPDAEIFLEKMDLDQTKLAHGKVIGTLINVNADEVFVLEANDEDDVEDLKASLEEELESQIQTWEQYLPDQHEKVKNNIIETRGKFLLYATFSNSEKLSKAFNHSFEN